MEQLLMDEKLISKKVDGMRLELLNACSGSRCVKDRSQSCTENTDFINTPILSPKAEIMRCFKERTRSVPDQAMLFDLLRISEELPTGGLLGQLPPIDDSKNLDACLIDMLLVQANAHPDTIAVQSQDGNLTFHDLVESSLLVAAHLRNLGVRPDTCVGICVHPSLDLMVGVWGILFAGGAYLPLSPDYPEERLRYMIDHARINVVFTQENLRAKVAELAPAEVQIVTSKSVRNSLRMGSITMGRSAFCKDLCPENLAYIIYTSGSTGKPKGVMIEHQSIVSQMKWLKETFGLGRKTVILQKTQASFDAAQWEILAPACGCTVVMGHPDIYRDVHGLIETIVKYDVNTLQCVPTLLGGLLEIETISDCRSLTQVFSGGEALSKELARRCCEKLPWCALINLYGPTECTINASAHVVDMQTDDLPGSISIPIGKPVKKTQFHLLDSQGEPVQPGEPGELYISGIQIARGYLHQPELTADRFINHKLGRLYKTGDLARQNESGSYQFMERADRQVKVRGYRVELDEVRLAIENHDWVKNAAVIDVQDETNNNMNHLVAYVELSPLQAALMDQGNHGEHHQSKAGRLQVKAQLSNKGCRDPATIAGKSVTNLPCKTPSKEQRELAFGRKTYRFYEGGDVTKEDLEQLLHSKPTPTTPGRNSETLTMNEMGELMRYFGQFISEERLLPKYGYASPGALYATQMYLQITGMAGLQSGYYYYHPVHHQLILIAKSPQSGPIGIKIHFIGKKQAIEPVYKNNILEVLEIETGHMLGLFDAVLPKYGLGIGPGEYTPSVINLLECHEDDYYLGSFALVTSSAAESQIWEQSLDLYIQAHPGKITDMSPGQYHYSNGDFVRVSDDLVRKNHTIAINQQVYDRASFGITVINKRSDWISYIGLGRKLQHMQMNNHRLGFMSAGYSSKSGNNLPAAIRINDILAKRGRESGSVYFILGGKVSEEQRTSEGMKEDTVHMKGPTEMVKEDLAAMLPDYMVPKRVVVLDKLPLTANGKIDSKALKELYQNSGRSAQKPFVPPRCPIETQIGKIWQQALKLDNVSITDDFFECGGNSLIAVSLIHQINAEMGTCLPLQTIFQAPTIESLACLVTGNAPCSTTRLIPLNVERGGDQSPIYCWPGLGGYTMNLRLLATTLGLGRSFYGVQAYGINQGEAPYATIKEMAARDIEQLKCAQPQGPYTLWGYSFGARVAFEAAYQMEQAGDQVDHVFLIAPGAPKLPGIEAPADPAEVNFRNKHFVAILFSVFTGRTHGEDLASCFETVEDEAGFVQFISTRFHHPPGLVQRVVQVVRETYSFKYTFQEMVERRVKAPITIFEASGDDYSFIEEHRDYAGKNSGFVTLRSDHYELLQSVGVKELVAAIRNRLGL